MVESVEVVARKWGNSFGFVIPKRVVDELGIRDGTRLTARLNAPKKTVLEEWAESGLFKDTGMTTEELIRQHRKENLFSKWI